jgi:hypothetical protein
MRCVFNSAGQRVAELVNEHQVAATYEVKLESSRLSSGVYFYQLETGAFTQKKKMTLIK